ncbi:hypothetical protein OG440_00690 [Streptomyces sp. NBC_00637]
MLSPSRNVSRLLTDTASRHPRIIQFVDELPLTSTGKILKRHLS